MIDGVQGALAEAKKAYNDLYPINLFYLREFFVLDVDSNKLRNLLKAELTKLTDIMFNFNMKINHTRSRMNSFIFDGYSENSLEMLTAKRSLWTLTYFYNDIENKYIVIQNTLYNGEYKCD
jgi:hypothetical protein